MFSVFDWTHPPPVIQALGGRSHNVQPPAAAPLPLPPAPLAPPAPPAVTRQRTASDAQGLTSGHHARLRSSALTVLPPSSGSAAVNKSMSDLDGDQRGTRPPAGVATGAAAAAATSLSRGAPLSTTAEPPRAHRRASAPVVSMTRAPLEAPGIPSPPPLGKPVRDRDSVRNPPTIHARPAAKHVPASATANGDPAALAAAQAAMDAYAGVATGCTFKHLLGAGSFGAVYAASHARLGGAPVAVKHISAAFGTPLSAKRVVREAAIMRHFRHLNVVGLLHAVPPADLEGFVGAYLITELMESDLHRVVRGQQTLTSDHIALLFYQLLCGLRHLHSGGVLHRDLKPSNVLVNSDCQLKIADFGLAREASPESHMTEYVVTRWYRAPELLLACKQYTAAVDVWSAGCIFAELLMRKPLFPGKSYLNQLELICSVLGTPHESELHFVTDAAPLAYMRGLAPRPPTPWPTICPYADACSLDLLNRMVCFDPTRRITLDAAIQHPFLARIRAAASVTPLHPAVAGSVTLQAHMESAAAMYEAPGDMVDSDVPAFRRMYLECAASEVSSNDPLPIQELSLSLARVPETPTFVPDHRPMTTRSVSDVEQVPVMETRHHRSVSADGPPPFLAEQYAEATATRLKTKGPMPAPPPSSPPRRLRAKSAAPPPAPVVVQGGTIPPPPPSQPPPMFLRSRGESGSVSSASPENLAPLSRSASFSSMSEFPWDGRPSSIVPMSVLEISSPSVTSWEEIDGEMFADAHDPSGIPAV